MILFLTIMLALSILLLGRAAQLYYQEKGKSEGERRLERLVAQQQAMEESVAPQATKRPLRERIVDSFERRARESEALRGEEGTSVLDWLDEQLILAGIRDRFTPYRAVGTALAIWFFGLVFPIFIYYAAGLPAPLTFLIVAVFLAYPYLKLRSLQRRRREAIEAEMLFFTNELLMSLSSGLNLDDALLNVASTNNTSRDDYLAREVELACNEYRVGGGDRTQALLDVVRRTQVPAVEALIKSVLAAFESGADPAGQLQEQADQSAKLWRESIRNYAARKGPKITLGVIETMGGGMVLIATPLVLSFLQVLTGTS